MEYLITFLVTFVIYRIYEKSDYTFVKYLIPLPLILLSGLRYDVGTDYMYRYFADYQYMLAGGIPAVEIGFRYLMSFLIVFTNNPQYLFLVTSLFIYEFIILDFVDHSKNFYFSMMLFFLTGYYFDSLNILRQYISIVFLLFSYYALQRDDIKRWIIYILIASLFHVSSIVFLIVYIPYKFEVKMKYVISFLLFVFFLILIGKPIFLEVLKFTPYSKYSGTTYLSSDFQLIPSCVVMSVSIVYLYFYFVYHEKVDKQIYLYTCLSLVATTFSLLSCSMFLFMRFVPFFSFFSLTGIPLIFSKIDKNKNIGRIFFMFLVLMLVICFIYLYIFHNYDEVFPYKFFNTLDLRIDSK